MEDLYKRRIYFIVFAFLMYWPHDVSSFYHYPTVFWTPNNCRFNLNRGTGGAYEFHVKPYGKVYFVCPNIALWRDMSMSGPMLSMMHENLILVDKEGYDTCTVNKTRSHREILRCDITDAGQLKFVEETFSSARASRKQMRYWSGKTYYFISTSNGTKESLDNLRGGHCKTHNMKLKITVCDMKGPCPFNMPKCPYSSVFEDEPTTTKSTPTDQGTTPVNNNSTNVSIVTSSTPTAAVKENDRTTPKEAESKYKRTLTTEQVVKPTHSKGARVSSDETIWGMERRHIIIHITMGLVVLVLALSLIYVIITRRRKQKNARTPTNSQFQFNSEYFKKRPPSALPLGIPETQDV